MFEVLKDVGFIGGIIMAAVAGIIFITEKIPEVIKYYRTVGGRRIAVKTTGADPLLPTPPDVSLKRLKNGLIRAAYTDKDGKSVKEEVNYEDLPALLAKISAESMEDEPVTEELTDKKKAASYAESIAEASATEVLPDMRIDEKTEYLN